MKTIGLLGGISWVSSADYYRIINEQINARLKGVNAGRIILYSVNYADIKRLTEEDRWDEITTLICDAAKKIENAGADCLIIGANTMHRLAPAVQAAIHIPLIHIAEVTADAILKQGITKVALLGTKYTMELDFFKDVLTRNGIETIIPEATDRAYINKAIYEEMGSGVFLPETKSRFLHIMQQMKDAGAGGIILGCTEIPLLVKQEDFELPLFDTTLIHASAAVQFALAAH
ncbi:MAG: aspartate/glutamate racemase family protein [Chitinophagaceae bacterium]|nr:MAG: aspartate/glutamate racemase family protein [Chitinophagaceae bacterium]